MEALFLGGPIQGQGKCFSIETLLDVLLVLYDECNNSSLRREKTVSDFIEFGMYITNDTSILLNLLKHILLNMKLLMVF